MKYNGKDYKLKFDNLATFNFAVLGLSAADLIITPNSKAERFCRAWACILDVPFDGDARAFMEGFGKFDVVGLNDEVIDALERDGVIPPAAEAPAKKKKSGKR